MKYIHNYAFTTLFVYRSASKYKLQINVQEFLNESLTDIKNRYFPSGIANF